jgi:hypothetical protein
MRLVKTAELEGSAHVVGTVTNRVVARGKVACLGLDAEGEGAEQRALTRIDDAACEGEVGRRIDRVESAGQNGDRATTGIERGSHFLRTVPK